MLAFDKAELGIILSALHEKATETEIYLSSYSDLDQERPAPTDVCCESHRARFEDRVAQKKALEERLSSLKKLIEAFEWEETRA